MAEGHSGLPSIPWERILGVVGVLGIVLLFMPPLTSSRPASPERTPHVADSDLIIDARLWQDPFDAVRREREEKGDVKAPEAAPSKTVIDLRVKKAFFLHVESQLPLRVDAITDESGPLSLVSLRKRLQPQWNNESTGRSIRILPVIVPGSPYPEDAERRLRTRYAVLSALSREFVPEDERHIGCVACRFGESGTNADTVETASKPLLADSTTVYVPYERWNPKEREDIHTHRPNPPVIILWISDESFKVHPLSKIAALLGSIPPSQGYQMMVKVIGPPSSDELISFKDDPQKPALPSLSIYSPWATDAKARDNLMKGDASSSIEWNIASNDDTAQALINELKLRNPDFGKDPIGTMKRIAIIAESGTVYVRSLRQSFDKVFRKMEMGQPVEADDRLTYFSYFRGIDGMLPSRPPMRILNPTDPTKILAETKDAYAAEMPVGPAQFDYLRGIAEQLKQREESLKRSSGGGLFAIGILGSDVYDKLSILQALRRKFPQAIFFTTDLDSRFCEGSQLDWTRNVVVASGYGLQVNRELQGFTPPFRDCYQTAAYYAVLRALRSPDEIGLPAAGGVHLFEIGNHGAFDLGKNVSPTPVSLDPIWEPNAAWRLRLFPLLAIVATFLVPAFILFKLLREIFFHALPHKMIGSLRTPYRRRLRRVGILLIGTVIFSAILFHVGMSDNDFGKGEPFAWLSGISIWPTELIRVFASFLAILFMINGWYDAQANYIELQRKFRLHAHRFIRPIATWFPWRSKAPSAHRGGPAAAEATGCGQWWNPARDAWFPWQWIALRGQPDPQVIWSEYRCLAGRSQRFWRSVLLLAIFMGMAASIMYAYGRPTAPARGAVAFFWDNVCLWLSVVCLLGLCATVVDAVGLNVRLVENLTAGISRWPYRAYASYRSIFPHAPDTAVSLLLDIEFFASRTRVVARVIYYPFIVCTVLIVSRLSCFDNWSWPPQLIAVIALPLLIALYCGWRLREASEIARRTTISRLKQMGARVSAPACGDIQRVISRIEDVKEGAFAPWYDQPIVESVLIPFGGLGLVTVLEYVLAMHSL